jgi:hypothetical protein
MVISIVSLIIAVAALLWNVYRDVALRARVRVRIAIAEPHGPDLPTQKFVLLEAANFGPGPVQISGVSTPLRRAALRKGARIPTLAMPLFDHPFSMRLPIRLEVGSTATIVLQYDADCFLRDPRATVAVSDSFGRSHRPSSHDLRSARKMWERDFGA